MAPHNPSPVTVTHYLVFFSSFGESDKLLLHYILSTKCFSLLCNCCLLPMQSVFLNCHAFQSVILFGYLSWDSTHYNFPINVFCFVSV